MAKAVPIVIICIGVFMLLPINWDFSMFPGKYQELAEIGEKALKETSFGAVFIVIGIGMYYKAVQKDKNDIHMVTNYRVYEKTSGMFDKKQQHIFLHHVKRIKIKANLISKMLHTGKMIIEDDSKQHKIIIENVSDPQIFKENIEAAAKKFAPMTKKMEKSGKFKELEKEHKNNKKKEM